MSSDVVDQVELAANPFAVLDVTTRDGRERIYEAVEDRSLIADPDACNEARAILTAPRRRFEAELGWFPGVSPSTAKRALDARSLAEVRDLPVSGLAMANALMAVALRVPPATLDQLIDLLVTMSTAVDEISLDPILRDVNEDREIAGFPPFTSTDTAEEMLRDRHQVWRRSVLSILSRLPTALMAEGLYRASEAMAEADRFPAFMHEVIEDYALRTQPFLLEEMAGATRLVEKAKAVAGSRPQALGPLIEAIGALLETWEEVTRPVQLSMTILGRTDRDSEKLGYLIRGLSIELHNEHDLSDEAGRITELLAGSFAALPTFAAKLSEDREAIAGFKANTERQEAENTYVAEIGAFRKTRIAVSPRMLEWKGKRYEVAQIRSARWGGINRSVNGIPTGTDYLIAWSDGQNDAVVQFRNKVIYEAFVERLWRVLAEPMLGKIVTGLRNGSEFNVGGAIIRDDGVELIRRGMFGEKRIPFGWGDVTIRNADGSFIIEGPAKSKASASLSFRDVPNVHFFEALVRAAFRNGKTQLSEAFA